MNVAERFQAAQVDEVLGLPPKKFWDDVSEFDPEEVFRALQEAVGRLTAANLYEDESGVKKASSYWNYAFGILWRRRTPKEPIYWRIGQVRGFLERALGEDDDCALVVEPKQDGGFRFSLQGPFTWD